MSPAVERLGPVAWVLGTFAAWMVGPLWLPGQALAVGDLLIYFPTLYRLPWDGGWDPYVMGGTPTLPNPQTGGFYPPSWPLAVDWFAAFPVYLWAHLLVGALGLWAWLRTEGFRGWAPVVAGLAWIGAGPTWSLVTKPDKLPGHTWLPFVLLGVSWMARRPRDGVTLVAVATAACWFGGSVEGVIVAALAAGGLALLRGGARAFAQVALGLVLAGLLAGVSVLPFLHLLPETTRAGGLGYAEATRLSVHPADLLRVVVPDTFRADVSPHWLASLYAGVVALALGTLGLRAPRALEVALLGLGFAFLSLGDTTPFYPLVHALPGVGSVQYPEKWWLGTVPFGAWLLAAGVTRLGRAGAVLALLVAAEGWVAHRREFPVERVEEAFAPSPALGAILADWRDAGLPRVWVEDVIRGRALPAVEGEPLSRTAHALLYPNVGARFGIADLYGAYALRGARVDRVVQEVARLPWPARVEALRGLGVDYIVVWSFEEAASLVGVAGVRPVRAQPGVPLDVPVLRVLDGPRPTAWTGPAQLDLQGDVPAEPVAWAPGWQVSTDGQVWADVEPGEGAWLPAPPPGTSAQYRFRAAGLGPGAAVTLVGLVGLVGLLLARRRLPDGAEEPAPA